MDLGLLTHVRVGGTQIPPLLKLSGLRVLQLDFRHSLYYIEVLKRLLDDSICPELEIVELGHGGRSDAEISDIKALLLEINRRRGHIELHIVGSGPYRHLLLPQLVSYPVSDPVNLSLFVSLTSG
jgi:hypothetical protein